MAGEVRIISPAGQVLQTLRLPAGDNWINGLQPGIYLIQVKGEKPVKVVM